MKAKKMEKKSIQEIAQKKRATANRDDKDNTK